ACQINQVFLGRRDAHRCLGHGHAFILDALSPSSIRRSDATEDKAPLRISSSARGLAPPLALDRCRADSQYAARRDGSHGKLSVAFREDYVVLSRRMSRHVTLTVALALGVLSARAQGASLMNFQLTNQGSQSIGRIDLNVLPPGAVIPPVTGTDSSGQPITGSPVTLLESSTGFDQSLFTVALGTKPDAQILRLLFGQTQTVDANGNVSLAPMLGSNGQPIGLFGPGAKLDFSLSVDSNLMSALRLELPDAASGIVLQSLPIADVPGNNT